MNLELKYQQLSAFPSSQATKTDLPTSSQVDYGGIRTLIYTKENKWIGIPKKYENPNLPMSEMRIWLKFGIYFGI